MKYVFILVSVAALVAAESFYYETENDNIDVDAIIADPAVFQTYIDCYLDRAPCSSLAASYKKYIQDSVIRACDRCNLPQRQRYAKFLWAMKTLLPHEYINFRQKYDPTGIYFDNLESVLSNYLQLSFPVPLTYYYVFKK